MTRSHVVLFAFCCGAIVGNLYYAQPIVDLIAPDVGLSAGAASLVVSLTQIGYAAGMFFIVPLADLVENRRLLLASVIVSIACLGAAVVATDPIAFLVISFLVGMSSVAVQILIPLAAHLAPEETRGRVVGNVMGGLMLGILLSRPIASFVADHFGWHAVFAMATGLMVMIALVFAKTMPRWQPDHRASYGALLRSLGHLLVRWPALRRRALYQGCMFASFSLFWTAAPLELVRHHGYSQSQVGFFALIGAMGAIAAPIGGRLADAGHTRTGTRVALLVGSLCWLPALALPSAAALVVTAVLIDFCVQMNMTIGQREIFALDPASRGRINALYMTSIFTGGAVGSSLASVLYAHGGWPWVVAVGALLPAIAFVRFMIAGSSAPAKAGAHAT